MKLFKNFDSTLSRGKKVFGGYLSLIFIHSENLRHHYQSDNTKYTINQEGTFISFQNEMNQFIYDSIIVEK